MDEEKIPYERLKQILCDYVSNDAEAIELSYVRNILRDVCGCDNEEGTVIAHVLLTNHGDIVTDWHDDSARLRDNVLEAVTKAKNTLSVVRNEMNPS